MNKDPKTGNRLVDIEIRRMIEAFSQEEDGTKSSDHRWSVIQLTSRGVSRKSWAFKLRN